MIRNLEHGSLHAVQSRLISFAFFSIHGAVMPAGPFRQTLIIRDGVRFFTVWVQPLGK